MERNNSDEYKRKVTEIIDMYREMPCLWNRQHPSYMQQGQRAAAYRQLLRAWNERFHEGATLPVLKAKLETMRCGFIRELKKVRQSKEKYLQPEDWYTPSLWYYNQFSFLESQYQPRAHNLSYEGSDTDNEQEETIEYLEEDESSNNSSSPAEQPRVLRDSNSRLLAFIDLYRRSRCLWDRRHPSYSRKRDRERAYEQLLRNYTKIDPTFTLRDLKTRVEIIRNGFIRELRKVRLSKQLSPDPSEWYSPRLWYYNQCRFLEKHYVPHGRTASGGSTGNHDAADEDVQSNNDEFYEDSETIVEYLNEDESNGLSERGETPLKKSRFEVDPKEDLEGAGDPIELGDPGTEPAACFGRAVGLQLQGLGAYQSAVAHKLISDVIFYAKLGRLSEDSLVAVTPRKHD